MIEVASGTVYEYDREGLRIRRSHPEHGSSPWLSLLMPVKMDGHLPGEGLILTFLKPGGGIEVKTTAAIVRMTE